MALKAPARNKAHRRGRVTSAPRPVKKACGKVKRRVRAWIGALFWPAWRRKRVSDYSRRLRRSYNTRVKRKLLVPQRDHGIDAHRATRGDVARQKRHDR